MKSVILTSYIFKLTVRKGRKKGDGKGNKK